MVMPPAMVSVSAGQLRSANPRVLRICLKLGRSTVASALTTTWRRGVSLMKSMTAAKAKPMPPSR